MPRSALYHMEKAQRSLEKASDCLREKYPDQIPDDVLRVASYLYGQHYVLGVMRNALADALYPELLESIKD